MTIISRYYEGKESKTEKEVKEHVRQ